jgi:hypothetical protein
MKYVDYDWEINEHRIVIDQEIFAQNAVANTLYIGNAIAQLTTVENNQAVYVFAGITTNLVIETTGIAELERSIILTRFNYANSSFSELNSYVVGPVTIPSAGAFAFGAFLSQFVGYYDLLSPVGNYAYTVGQTYSVISGGANIANVILTGADSTVLVQTIKR